MPFEALANVQANEGFIPSVFSASVADFRPLTPFKSRRGASRKLSARSIESYPDHTSRNETSVARLSRVHLL